MDPSKPELSWRRTTAEDAQSRHDDVYFLTPALGWAANSDGKIIKTEDGGMHWDTQFVDEDVYWRCLGFASKSRGWAGTIGGAPNKRLFETFDGGVTWTAVADLPQMAPSWICGLSVVNESVVYASGTNEPFPARSRPPRMMKTMDGGKTWFAWDMSLHASLLVDTYFTSATRGWVVGGAVVSGVPLPAPTPEMNEEWRVRANVKPVVLLTEDGGQTWDDRLAEVKDNFPLGEWGWKIQFLNDQLGFVSLENAYAGAILKTTDGGRHWNRIEVKDPQGNINLEGIGFLDEKTGWVGGWGTTEMEEGEGGFSSATCNGGETWADANQIGTYINRFRFLGDPVTVGYAAASAFTNIRMSQSFHETSRSDPAL